MHPPLHTDVRTKASLSPLMAVAASANSERVISRLPHARRRRSRDLPQTHSWTHFVVSLIRSKRVHWVRPSFDRILVVVVTTHKLVPPMSKVSPERLKQPPRVNNGSFVRNSAAVQFDG